MKRLKNTIFYVGLIGGFTALMVWIVQRGERLEVGRNVVLPDTGRSQWQEFLLAMQHNLEHPLAILLAQIITIVVVARVFGWICRKLGQPSVIGEIIAGIALGPTLLGSYFPEFSSMLFPEASLGNLKFLSQFGLILFMFVIGMELDLKVLKNKAHDAVVISHASIIIPFALGLGLAYFIYAQFAPMGVQFSSFGLFMGIAMSITAFPVLARIVQERGLHKTRLGTVVITCAAADDITAWCLLAAVIAIVKAGSLVSALYIIVLAALYVGLMLYVVRPFLSRIGSLYYTRDSLSKPMVAVFLLTLLASAYATEVIGIHALFGAFMAGAITPENARFRSIFIEKVEDVALVLLLPLFFVFTGLRTQIGLLDEPYLWQITGWIVLVAVVGKFVGSALAARFVGQNWQDSLTIGALMNTRGLMELVVLNIGYDLGVLTPEIFAMMVIMALATTFMTGPALDLIGWVFNKAKASVPNRTFSSFKILIAFGHPQRGKSLLRLAQAFLGKHNTHTSVTALHLTSAENFNNHQIDAYEKDSFLPINEESARIQQPFSKIFKASNDIEVEIADTANAGEFDMLMIGLGQSIFEGSLLGKVLGFTTRLVNPENLLNQVTGKDNLLDAGPFDERTRHILSRSKVAVGILIDKNFDNVDKVLLPVFSERDASLLNYAQRLIKHAGSQITVLDVGAILRSNAAIKEQVRLLEQQAPNHIQLLDSRSIDKAFLATQSMMLVGIDSWKLLVESKSLWLADVPSVLIVKPGQPIAD